MKKIFGFIFALGLIAPQMAMADLSMQGESVSVNFNAITVNPEKQVEGQNARVTVTIYNRSTAEQSGVVDIYAGKIQIADNLSMSVPARGVDSATVDWKPRYAGTQTIKATIISTSGDDDTSNNSYSVNVTVLKDTDGDGVPDVDDDDDDNDGCWDYQDSFPLDSKKGCEKNETVATTTTNTETTKTTTDSGSTKTQTSSEISVDISPVVGKQVDFGAVSDESIAEGSKVIWEFSDGKSYTGTTVRRTFDSTGEYSVVKTIIAPDKSVTSSELKFVVNEPDETDWVVVVLAILLAILALYFMYKYWKLKLEKEEEKIREEVVEEEEKFMKRVAAEEAVVLEKFRQEKNTGHTIEIADGDEEVQITKKKIR